MRYLFTLLLLVLMCGPAMAQDQQPTEPTAIDDQIAPLGRDNVTVFPIGDGRITNALQVLETNLILLPEAINFQVVPGMSVPVRIQKTSTVFVSVKFDQVDVTFLALFVDGQPVEELSTFNNQVIDTVMFSLSPGSHTIDLRFKGAAGFIKRKMTVLTF